MNPDIKPIGDIPPPDDGGSGSAEEPTAEDMAEQAADAESEHRLWLKGCLAICAIKRTELESAAVSSALDSLVCTAAARAKRILRSDLRLSREST
jgi:hypothetical protein